VTAPRALPDLSVVVPVFNERDNLEPLVSEIVAALAPAGRAFEIILVDDGSTDGSAEKIAEMARSMPSVRGVHFRGNAGQTAAIDAGFKAARGSIVITMDADLQNDPRDIPALLAALTGHDAAIGYRRDRQDPWIRKVSATIARVVRNRACHDDTIDTGCSLKAFRKESVDRLKLFTGMHRFFPVLLRMEGCSVVQVPVGHRPRRHGSSKYGVLGRLVHGIADLMAVRWMQRRNLRYEVRRHDP
jgi:glycosyltransferase involved in cell wall biosynthesis